MQVFLDDKNQKWEIELTIDIAEEIHKRCERPDSTPEQRKTFDLLSVVDVEQSQYFQPFKGGRIDKSRVEKLVDMFWVLMEKQCRERKMSEYDFAKMLQGGTLGRGVLAFQQELLNFIPSPDFREAVIMIMNSVGGVDVTALRESTKRFNTLETVRNAGILEALDIRMQPYQKLVEEEKARLKKQALEDAAKPINPDEELSMTDS
jgi:hypothetical protein